MDERHFKRYDGYFFPKGREVVPCWWRKVQVILTPTPGNANLSEAQPVRCVEITRGDTLTRKRRRVMEAKQTVFQSHSHFTVLKKTWFLLKKWCAVVCQQSDGLLSSTGLHRWFCFPFIHIVLRVVFIGCLSSHKECLRALGCLVLSCHCRYA